MNNTPFPLEGGSYRVIDGKLVRDDAATTDATPTPPATSETATETTPALRGRKPSREE